MDTNDPGDLTRALKDTFDKGIRQSLAGEDLPAPYATPAPKYCPQGHTSFDAGDQGIQFCPTCGSRLHSTELGASGAEGFIESLAALPFEAAPGPSTPAPKQTSASRNISNVLITIAVFGGLALAVAWLLGANPFGEENGPPLLGRQPETAVVATFVPSAPTTVPTLPAVVPPSPETPVPTAVPAAGRPVLTVKGTFDAGALGGSRSVKTNYFVIDVPAEGGPVTGITLIEYFNEVGKNFVQAETKSAQWLQCVTVIEINGTLVDATYDRQAGTIRGTLTISAVERDDTGCLKYAPSSYQGHGFVTQTSKQTLTASFNGHDFAGILAQGSQQGTKLTGSVQ